MTRFLLWPVSIALMCVGLVGLIVFEVVDRTVGALDDLGWRWL